MDVFRDIDLKQISLLDMKIFISSMFAGPISYNEENINIAPSSSGTPLKFFFTEFL